ncbi:MAG: glycoside hydrolase family 3 N-terminal domain-containing protein [Muribaculaceae bacterium]
MGISLNISAKSVEKYKNPSLPVEVRVQDLLKRMTLEEKIAQMRHVHARSIMTDGKIDEKKLDQMLGGKCYGFIEGITLPGRECLAMMNATQKYMREKTRLAIPIFTVSESLHGSVHDGSTIFPQAIALGSTFNTDLAYEMTSAIAEELRAQSITQSLTPVIDVCRDLRWGRAEECFGEDPFLVSRMGVKQVRGYLDHGISPMIKHFGAHGSPQGGLNLASVSCGERELLSIYLKTFETVVKEAKPWAVMSSYNSWNNQPNSSSHYLLTELLRNQWGFKGYVYSDWGSIGMLHYFHHTAQNGADAAIQALTAGLDAEASDNCYAELQQLVEKGLLEEAYIDQAVARILTAKFSMGLFDNTLPSEDNYDKEVHTSAHVALARKIADESIVLLKNSQNLLPLRIDELKSMAVIGPNAHQVQFGDYTWSRNNADGTTLLEALQEKVGNKITLNYAKGCDLVTDNRSLFDDAVEAARRSDVAVVVVGSASASLARDYSNATCGEGFDLSDLTLPGVQEDLIKAVYATGKPVIVVLLSGKPFAMPWVKEHIPGIVVQWYPGEQGGYALADMLFGEVNPSGKLNYSFPQSVGHLPCYYNHLPSDKGYYHNPGKPNKPGQDYVFSSPDALWTFGTGLSYTEFEYLSATTQKDDYAIDDVIEVAVTIKNTGNYDGKEVPQIYVCDVVSSVVTPVKQLKGFDKIFIKKGETKQTIIRIPVSELALYNKSMERVVEPGAFELQIGSSSSDIRLKKTITVAKDKMLSNPTLKNLGQKSK